MRVVHAVSELQHTDRAVALGTFDGVHLGHRRVIETAIEAGLVPTVITFHPHPRRMLGYGVELLATLERRLELLAELGVEDTLVVEFTLDFQRIEADEFARHYIEAIGARVVVAGADFRFGHRREGDLDLLAGLGFDVRPVPLLEGVSSSLIRQHLHAGDVPLAAPLLGRPAEVEGVVVEGDARGGTLGFPTANLSAEADLLIPAHGIYAGFAAGHRAAVSIGTNPHYGGDELRIEAFLLGYEGDLYGQRLVVELWERLRDEQTFESEQALIDQIARDVEATEQAERPA
ncbi:MAG: riboflavin biosynthesis protein RibF [Verrucomicrobiota bacterium]